MGRGEDGNRWIQSAVRAFPFEMSRHACSGCMPHTNYRDDDVCVAQRLRFIANGCLVMEGGAEVLDEPCQDSCPRNKLGSPVPRANRGRGRDGL